MYVFRDARASVSMKETLEVSFEPASSTTSIVKVFSTINPFRTAVPFWGQSSQFISSLSPKRDCGPKRVKI